MTFGGWITFLASVWLFTWLFLWCIYKVLTVRKNNAKDMKKALDSYGSGKARKSVFRRIVRHGK